MVKHLTIKISGYVQGVFFRYSAKQKADQLNIKGLAENLADGTVSIEAEGDEAKLNEFIKWCHQGPDLAKVEKVEVKEGDLQKYQDFNIG